MALTPDDGGALKAFADLALRQADETCDTVVPVVMAVVGGILTTAEPGSVAGLETPLGPTVRASFGGCRMAFTYNALTAMVDLRSESLDGHPERRFGHRSLAADIANFFGPDRAARQARAAR